MNTPLTPQRLGQGRPGQPVWWRTGGSAAAGRVEADPWATAQPSGFSDEPPF